MTRADAHIPALLARVVYLAQLRALAGARFEAGLNGAVRVRANDVATVVAGELGVLNSPAFRRDLRHALVSLGWRPVKTDGVARWMGVRAK